MLLKIVRAIPGTLVFAFGIFAIANPYFRLVKPTLVTNFGEGLGVALAAILWLIIVGVTVWVSHRVDKKFKAA